jgi:RHS repeat-associated protein
VENDGSMKFQTITVPLAGANQGFTATQNYSYDSLNRLESATETIGNNPNPTWRQAFTYDRYGNRRFNESLTTTLGTNYNQATVNPTISTANNRISSAGYSYDGAGNLRNDANGKQFLYDAENHQNEVKDGNGITLGIYLYDGEGRRIKKISATETVIFVYDGGGQLVAEYSTQTPTNPTINYLTADHLGSPRVITDAIGKVAARKDFGAFGDETFTPQRTNALGYKPEEIRQDYTGYQRDDESGLEFAQARYYNPGHGRFTSIDPLTASANVKDPQTFNRYSYAMNSPYKFTDPLGLISSSTGACGQWCRGSGDYVDGSAFTGRDTSFEFGSGDTYYTTTRTSQYSTTAQDGNRVANVTITVTESLVMDRNGNVVVSDPNPSVSSSATNAGSNPLTNSELRSIEKITTTAVRLAIQRNFDIPTILAILKTETQFGILPNKEGVPHKKSEINPGQFSKSSGLGQAVSEADGYTFNQALEINIGKTMDKWNHESVQRGNTMNAKFQLYNNEASYKVAYGKKAEGNYNAIKSSMSVATV